ncbi:MAG TPA: hypothetical protein VN616_03145 [Puia sp.]|nr:hypothetical protein [Puia sp.]
MTRHHSLLLFLFLAGAQLRLTAQCPLAPAECPVNGADQYGTADDSASRMSNPVLPLEIRFENRLRNWTNGVMDRITAKEHWTYTEISEEASSGFRADDYSVLKYPLRPPHWISLRYQVIIDGDSVKAWHDWLLAFAQRRLDATMAYAKQQTDYAAALKADDNFEKERQRMTIHYGEACRIFVEFEFNSDYAKLDGSPGAGATQTTISAQTIWLKNPDPVFNAVDFYERAHTHAVLLIGNWKRTADGSGYRPTWYGDRKSRDVVSEKRIKCDELQSIDVHLSGNVAAIKKCLADLSPAELTSQIAQ